MNKKEELKKIAYCMQEAEKKLKVKIVMLEEKDHAALYVHFIDLKKFIPMYLDFLTTYEIDEERLALLICNSIEKFYLRMLRRD